MRPSIPLTFHVLIAPVLDNTSAAASERRRVVPYVPTLTPDLGSWFRRNFLPKEEDWNNWDALILAPNELLRDIPKAWIGAMEVDVLRPEGLAYRVKLKEAGVDVETVVYKGALHDVVALTSK